MDIRHIAPGRHFLYNPVTYLLQLIILGSAQDGLISPAPSHEAHGRGRLYRDGTVVNIRHFLFPQACHLIRVHGPVIFQISGDGAAVAVIAQHVGLHIFIRSHNCLGPGQHFVRLF